MALREFVTSAEAAVAEERGTAAMDREVMVDGRKVKINGPTEGQISVFLAGASDSSAPTQALASTINFFFSLLEEDDVRYFKVRLLDRNDPFEGGMIVDIIEYLMGEWSARPTKQPSDFMPPQSTGGQRSTARRHKAASTPST